MTENAVSFLKLVSSILSPQLAIRTLCVGVFMLVSPNFSLILANAFGLDNVFDGEIVNYLIGVSLGSLVGSLIVIVYEYIFGNIVSFKLRKRKEVQNYLSQERIKSSFSKAFKYFDSDTKHKMYLLAKEGCSFHKNNRFCFEFVHEGFVDKTSRLGGGLWLVEMKEFLKDDCAIHYKSYKESLVREILEENTGEVLFRIMEDGSRYSDDDVFLLFEKQIFWNDLYEIDFFPDGCFIVWMSEAMEAAEKITGNKFLETKNVEIVDENNFTPFMN